MCELLFFPGWSLGFYFSFTDIILAFFSRLGICFYSKAFFLFLLQNENFVNQGQFFADVCLGVSTRLLLMVLHCNNSLMLFLHCAFSWVFYGLEFWWVLILRAFETELNFDRSCILKLKVVRSLEMDRFGWGELVSILRWKGTLCLERLSKTYWQMYLGRI